MTCFHLPRTLVYVYCGQFQPSFTLQKLGFFKQSKLNWATDWIDFWRCSLSPSIFAVQNSLINSGGCPWRTCPAFVPIVQHHQHFFLFCLLAPIITMRTNRADLKVYFLNFKHTTEHTASVELGAEKGARSRPRMRRLKKADIVLQLEDERSVG